MTTYKEAFEAAKNRLVALAAADTEGRTAYTGSAIALGLTYRADDMSIVWTGDGTFVVIPREGEIDTRDVCPDRSALEHVIEGMCEDGIGMCKMIADVHRMELAQNTRGRSA